jgi:hypothetical protein
MGMGEQMSEISHVPGEGIPEAGHDGGGVVQIEPGVADALAKAGYFLRIYRPEGSKGFWFEVVKRESRETVFGLIWDEEQTWSLDTPECECDVSPSGVSFTADRPR